MQQLRILVAIPLMLVGPTTVLARCGSDPGDAAAVAAVEAAVATSCDCCAPQSTTAACVVSVMRAALRARTLPGRCVSKVRRDVIHACPAAPAGVACRICSSDADCASNQFCECRAGTCTKTGGVCTPRPQVCPDVVAPVCGCDGTTYANDCLRQQAGTCKLHRGACVETGGCFDTIERRCTGQSCSPTSGCPLPNEFCSPACATPPPVGRCFDTLSRKCTGLACDAAHPCLPNSICVATCPPPPPAGRCFVTVDLACSDEPCGPGHPCRNPNELCSPRCLTTTTTTTLPSGGCTTDADCDDGNGCSVDRCVGGQCQHACICADPTGAASCCPGPSTLCVRPCGADAAGTCGGMCAAGATCETIASTGGCGCVSGEGGPCGGNILMPPPVCGPGLVCKQVNPDVTGVCVPATCIPLSQSGCTQTDDCCSPCTVLGRAPCAVCLQGSCIGTP